jgi:hypothetical protein
MISFLGLILILVWALSPVGGQAPFRQITIGMDVLTKSASFTYMIRNGNMVQYDDSDRSTDFAVINALFVSSVISTPASKASTVDTWGNVKIPMIEPYENVSRPDDQGWFTINGNDNTHYSSLVGIPIAGITLSYINYTMSIETTYLSLDCPIINGWDENQIMCTPGKMQQMGQGHSCGLLITVARDCLLARRYRRLEISFTRPRAQQGALNAL